MMDYEYYFSICDKVAEVTKCLSVKRGSIIITPDKTIVSMGYNGPPRNVAHCNSEERLEWICKQLKNTHVGDIKEYLLDNGWGQSCPRRILKFKSGEGLQFCPAGHSEANAIFNAARHGINLKGCYLIHNTCLPCQECSKAIINSGIVKVITRNLPDYDAGSRWLLEKANVEIIQV